MFSPSFFPPGSRITYPTSGPIDTDERRAVARALTDALYEYLTLPITEMERAYKLQSEVPPMTVERIVEAQEQVEKIREALEEGRAKVETAMAGQMEHAAEEVKGVIRLQLEALYVDPLANQLKAMEEWLSGMQAELEKGESAV